MTDKLYEEILEEHYLEIYEEYCKRHPEEITSDFILDEDGNEDYIKTIMEELYMKGEFISIETAQIMADIEKENKELQQIIEKTIKYLEPLKDGEIGSYEINEILKILKGSDDNE